MTSSIKTKATLLISFYLTSPLVFAELKKPALLTSASADTTKVDVNASLFISTILEWTVYAGLVGMVIGLLMTVPFIGKKEIGIAGMKGSFIVIVVAALFDGVILPLISKLF